MSNKYAWVWNVKEECVQEYVKMHLNPWPEIMKAYSAAGIRNYSIFQNGTQFFYEFECDGDPAEAFAKMTNDPDCIRWNSITSKMLDIESMKNGDLNTGAGNVRGVIAGQEEDRPGYILPGAYAAQGNGFGKALGQGKNRRFRRRIIRGNHNAAPAAGLGRQVDNTAAFLSFHIALKASR
jgi:L-rhamnose mutarotase